MASGDFSIKLMSIREFREKGFLQEANRQFFHPLGLALQVTIEDEGDEKISGVWDYRDDPEGMIFDELDIDIEKVNFIKSLQNEKAKTRMEILGFVIQRIPKRVTRMNANIKPMAHEPKRPVSVEREHPDRLIIEGVRFAGDYFRETAHPDPELLYAIKRDEDGVIWLTQIRSVEGAKAFFAEVNGG